MEARHPRLLFFCLMALIAIVTVHTAAAARPFPAGSVCHAAAGLEEDEERVLADRGRWTCDPAGWPIDSSRAYLRFDLAGAEPPMRFVTRLTRFEAMRITAIGTDGRLVAREVREADMTPLTTAWRMATALPKLGEPAAAIVVRVDGARHSGFLADAKVVPDRPETAAEVRGELLVAALCGMLCLPLVFNFAFLRVLRERFLLWHALAVVCMLGQTLITSGVVNRFANLSLEALCVSSAVTWGLGIVAAAMFSADFIEPGMLDRVHRRLMRGTAPWIAAGPPSICSPRAICGPTRRRSTLPLSRPCWRCSPG